MDVRRPRWQTTLIVAILMLAAVLLSGCRSAPVVDQPAAIDIATKFAVDSQPAGSQIRGLRVTDVSDAGAPGGSP